MAASKNLDPTFRHYSTDQAAKYAQNRDGHPQLLYDTIIKYHTETGGQLDTVLDLGCGPGNATRDLARYFDHAYGADAGAEMIGQAQNLGGKTRAGNDIEYRVAAAEDVGEAQGIKSGSVDMITVAMAAHWFRMNDFWPNAKKLLKVGGTVAIWTRASYYVHPETPHFEELQRLFSHLEDNVLVPYEEPGNKLSRGMYNDLTLPWQVHPPVAGFSEAEENFKRVEWNKDGKVEPGKDFLGGGAFTPGQIERALGTASMVTRWREANPEVANTENDPVKLMASKVIKIMGSAEVKIKTGASTALLLLKRIGD